MTCIICSSLVVKDRDVDATLSFDSVGPCSKVMEESDQNKRKEEKDSEISPRRPSSSWNLKGHRHKSKAATH